MLDDRERAILDEIEQVLLTDPGLRRRWRSHGPRVRHALVTASLVVLVTLVVVTAVGLMTLDLPGQSIIVLMGAVWPVLVVRRRLRRRGERRGDLG